jgi:hypothetical protein
MHLLIANIMFVLQLHTGVIIPTDDVDGRTIYSVPSAGIEYAYKAEIIQYMETGVFTYDETLEDPVKESDKSLTKN